MTSVEEAPAAAIAGWDQRTATVCGEQVAFLQAGRGEPLLVLPGDNGHPPRRDFASLLAERFSVTYPWYPGFHGPEPAAPWEWLTNVRDLAITQRQLVEQLGLQRLTIVGLGFGGWVAAEMATMAQAGLRSLVLVNPMGIRPERSYIYDQFLVSTEAYARTGFEDQAAFEALYGEEPPYEQLDAWETDRGMTSRLAWKPYMYNPALPRLLSGVKVPALIVTGDSDKIVPPECGDLYRAALPNATLEKLPGCGHAIDREHPAALAAAITSFLNRAG
jgi:pimeloyl-ACP methyl ester carboxylesterase